MENKMSHSAANQRAKSRRCFVYKEKEYKSMASFLRGAGIPDQSIFSIMRSEKCTAQEAIDIWYSRKNPREIRSIKRTAILYGIPYDTFRGKYRGDKERFIKSRIEDGSVLPLAPVWIESDWEPCPDEDKSLRVIGTQAICYKDSANNVMYVFNDSEETPFQIQCHATGLWMFRAGPLPSFSDIPLSLSPYGALIQTDKGLFLQVIQIGKRLSWAEVTKIVSVMSRTVIAEFGNEKLKELLL